MGLTVVTGPPCAGKSTYIEEHRSLDDVVIDVDRLAVALGADADHIDWSDGGSAHRILAREVRAWLVRELMKDLGTVASSAGREVWLVDTAPRGWQRRSYRAVGATIVDLDPGREVCHERAKAAGRSVATHGEIERWYAEAANR
jgi:hypothetical protein